MTRSLSTPLSPFFTQYFHISVSHCSHLTHVQTDLLCKFSEVQCMPIDDSKKKKKKKKKEKKEIDNPIATYDRHILSSTFLFCLLWLIKT